MRQQVSFTPISYDLPPGPRVMWIGSLLKGRTIPYQVVNDPNPRLIVYPKSLEQLTEAEGLVKMVLTYQSTGPVRKRVTPRAKVLFALALLLAFVLMVLIVYSIRLLLSYFFGW